MIFRFQNFFLLIFIAGCAFTVTGCSDDEQLPNTLAAPQFVVKSNDTAAFERGIRAWPGSSEQAERGIRLEWHGITIAPIGGYNIYRTNIIDSIGKPNNFLKIATLEKSPNFDDTVYVDTKVVEGVRYFYKVAAFERAGTKQEGDKSKPEEFTLLSAIEGVTPHNGAAVEEISGLLFRWKIENGNSGYSVLRVYEINPVSNAIISPVWIFGGFPAFDNPSFRFNEDGKAISLRKGRTYGWYISQVVPGQRNRGSASTLKKFTIK
jgi:hypothetical protein